MKPSAFRIERLLAKVEAEVERRGLRARRYVFILTRWPRQKRKRPAPIEWSGGDVSLGMGAVPA